MSVLVQQFLNRWESSKSIKKLFHDLVCFQFVQLNHLQSLDLPFPPHLVLYKHQNPIIGPEGIKFSEQDLPLGKLYPLQSLIGGFGYLFEFPNARIVHGPGYFGIHRRIATDILTAQVIHKSQYLNIFSSEDGILCIGRIVSKYVDRYGFKNANSH